MKPEQSLLQGKPYVNSANTNIAKTFDRIRREQRQQVAEQLRRELAERENVTRIPRKSAK